MLATALAGGGHGLRELLDELPAAVYTTDSDGILTYFNRAAERLAGRAPRIGEDRWSVVWKLFTADGVPMPFDQCPMAITLKKGAPVRNVEIIAERPNGERVAVMPFPTPLRDANGRVIGALNMLVDVSTIKRAESAATLHAEQQEALYRFTDRLQRVEGDGELYDAALDAILSALKCDRAAILLFDQGGVMRFVAWRGLSDGYRAAVDGHSPWKRGDLYPMPIAIEAIAASEEPEALKQIIQGEGVAALAFIPLVVNGGVIGKFMAYYDAPHAMSGPEFNLALTIARQLSFAVDRNRIEIESRRATQAQQLLSSIVENSDDAIISKDLNGIISSWNQGAERLFGYKPEEIIGRSILTLIPLDYQDEEPGIIGRIRKGERIEHFETVRLRKNGSRVHISLTVSPVKDSNGVIVGASKIARDITDRKRADEQRTLLINELNHRVKNTLATVQSLASQTLRSTERSAEARALFDARLSALSRAHDLLTQQNWVSASLKEVINRALTPFRAGEDRFVAQGPDIELSPKQVLGLSIALHELATNAAKYGALSNASGAIDLSWTIDNGMLALTWREHGGPAVRPPTRAGFGSRLIQRNLAADLGGQASISYDPEGVVAAMATPVEQAHAFGAHW